MFFDLTEDKTKSLERKISSVSLEIERQNKQINNLFAELGITQEELKQFLKNKDNFSQKSWDFLESYQALSEEEDLQALSPAKTQKTLEEQKEIAPHWIFCR